MKPDSHVIDHEARTGSLPLEPIFLEEKTGTLNHVLMLPSTQGMALHQENKFFKIVLCLKHANKNYLASDTEVLIPVDKVNLNWIFFLSSLWFISQTHTCRDPLNSNC